MFQNVLDQRQNLSLHFAITVSFNPKPEILKQFRISFHNFTVIIKSILKFVLKPNHEKNWLHLFFFLNVAYENLSDFEKLERYQMSITESNQ